MLPPGNVRDRDPNKAKEQPSFDVAEVPPHIDYEKWLGPAPLSRTSPRGCTTIGGGTSTTAAAC